MNQFIKPLIIVLLAVFSSVQIVEAQKIKGELIFGMNTTQIDGDEIYGYHKY